jgi:hypothetical protein
VYIVRAAVIVLCFRAFDEIALLFAGAASVLRSPSHLECPGQGTQTRVSRGEEVFAFFGAACLENAKDGARRFGSHDGKEFPSAAEA